MELVFENIEFNHKCYLKEGTLIIPENKITVLIGPNGSGKTSLLKNIFFHNRDKNIVFVSQNNSSIITEISVLENISMNLNDDYNKEIKREIVNFGFEDILLRNIRKLSGGEKRLVSFLRGVFSPEPILLIDEPTNDLDYDAVKKISVILSKLKKEKTIVVISHDDRILSLADKRYEIKNQELKCEDKATNFCKKCGKPSKQYYKKDENMLFKSFKINWVQVLSFVIFGLTFFYMIALYANASKSEPVLIADNQINIYSPVSTIGSGTSINNTFSSKYLEVLDDSSYINKMKLLNEEDSDDGNIFLDEYTFEKKNGYTIYPIEYYDSDNKISYFTLDLYLNKKYNKTQYDIDVDTEEYFQQPYTYSITDDKVQEFDINLYSKCVEELENRITDSEKKLRLVCMVVVFDNGYNKNEFVDLELYEKIKNSTMLVTYNPLTLSVSGINRVKVLIKYCVIFFFICSIIIFMNSCYWLLFIKVQKEKIIIFKYYNYTYEQLQDVLIGKSNKRFPYIILWIILFVVNIFHFLNISFSQMNYYWIFFTTIVLSLVYELTNYIIKKYIKKCFRWYI